MHDYFYNSDYTVKWTDFAWALISIPSPAVSITATDAAKPEGNSGTTAFTFTVTRSGDTGGTTTVNYAVSGMADAADFQGGVLPSGTVTFGANETTKTITINVAGDKVREPDETLRSRYLTLQIRPQ